MAWTEKCLISPPSVQLAVEIYALMDTENIPENFACLKCGACCRWSGNVLLTQKDITAISTVLKIPENIFVQKYTTLTANRSQLTLIEQPSGACCFLTEDNVCGIYDTRPQQCRDFPHLWHVKGCPNMDSISKHVNKSHASNT